MLRELAEYPNSFGPLGPDDERIETERYTLCMGNRARWNTVQRQRFEADEVDGVLEEVRAHLRARGAKRTQWEIGSQARPSNLVELLRDRGLVPDREPYATAMVLRSEPEPPPADVTARPVETYDEYRAASEVQHIAFAMAEPFDETGLRERWKRSPNVTFAAWVDGRIVGAATGAPTAHGMILYGGATHPDARGRGAYRALVHARWVDAVARGTPVLVTQAGHMSEPILARLGFEAVGWNHVLVDEFDRPAP